MSDHHPLGPSTLSRRAACPGSYAAELPLWSSPEEPSADASAGTRRHEAAAAGLRDSDARLSLLADLPAEDHSLVSSWWAYWDDVQTSADEVLDGGAETPVTLSGGRHGTCDAWVVVRSGGARLLVVGDLKGQPPGPARSNLQLHDYACGLAEAVGPLDAVRLVLVSRAGVDEYTLGRSDLHSLSERLDAVLSAAQAPDAPRRPGDHCGYCRAVETCDVRREVAVRSAGLLSVLADPVSHLASLSPEQRTQTLDNICLAAESLEHAERSIKTAIRDGSLIVPQYRAVASTRQEWTDAASARETLRALAVASSRDPEELTPLVSPSQARAICGAAAVDPLTTRRQGTATVRRAKTPPAASQPVIAASPMTAARAEDPLFTGGAS